jgi:cytochrome c oxidase subunit 2
LCGIKHAFMPITVEVVSEQKYKEWVEMAKVKYAMYPEKKFLAKKEQ